jgi:hypothetical protein
MLSRIRGQFADADHVEELREGGRVIELQKLVELAFKNYEGLPAAPPNPEDPDKFTGIETPDRLAFALGWIVANTVVQRRYRSAGIDALPIYHPEHGWDRFLLTRRITSPMFGKEPANSFGMIMLDGEDAPRLTTPGGRTILSLGKAMREDPVAALKAVLKHIPREEMPEGKHGIRWKDRRKQYPRQYRAITEIIIENPGAVAAREIFVDDKPIDGAYHPLYLHGATLEPKILYDWFMVQLGRWAVFFRNHGGQTIFETDRRTWSTVKKQINEEEDYLGIKRRIEGFLRLNPEQLAEEQKRPTGKAKRKNIKRGKVIDDGELPEGETEETVAAENPSVTESESASTEEDSSREQS